MSRRLIPAALFASLALLAGCGGGEGTRPASSSPDPGAIDLAATDGRTGPAVTARRGATRLLSAGGPIDPAAGRDPRRRDGVAAGGSCPDTDVAPSADTLPAVEAATLCLINAERAAAGLPALRSDARLAAAASRHADAMVREQFFAHEGPAGDRSVDRIRDAGYLPRGAAWLVGENLAWGTGALATPRAIVDAWMNSSGHRANILRDGYRDVGQGIVLGNPRSRDGAGATYAMTFGAVEGAAVAPASASGAETGKRRSRGSRTRKSSRRSKARSSRRAVSRRKAAHREARRRARQRRAQTRRRHRAEVRRVLAHRALAPEAAPPR